MPDPAPKHPATWEDLEDVSDEYVGEIFDGEMILRPRPGVPHARASSRLGAIILGPFDFGAGGPGGWVILDEPRIKFGANTLVPDIAGWHKERFEEPARGPITVIPDWVCEILSPGTEGNDRGRKMKIYARDGVSHMWLMSPGDRALEVFRLRDGEWLLVNVHEGTARVRAEPFDAIELDLGLVWGDDMPPRP
jgi:Uma2 family endonuclease